MKVVHVITTGRGGAAIACIRLHLGLLAQGIDSHILSLHEVQQDIPQTHAYTHPAVKQAPVCKPIPSLKQRVEAKAKRILKEFKLYNPKPPARPKPIDYFTGRPAGLELFSGAVTPFDITTQPIYQEADVVNLHWVAELLDYESFFARNTKKLVWTLHDMNPFTGGCHYALGCENHKQTGCNTCPQLNENRSETDPSAVNFAIKKKSLARAGVHVVADSFWLEREARQSLILAGAASIQTIHYGLQTHIFCPKDKTACRKLLNIDENKFVICFGSEAVTNQRKGFRFLLEAIQALSVAHPDIYCLAFGAGKASLPEGVQVKFLGTIESIELQAIVYSAADVFVIPSLHEAFGQTALEAMACGTPAVGFNTGGIPDMIQPGRTGLLAEAGSVADLTQKIAWMIQHPAAREEMGKASRKLVEQSFTLENQANRYIELYEGILGRTGDPVSTFAGAAGYPSAGCPTSGRK